MRHPLVPEELKAGPFSMAEARQAGLSQSQLRGQQWRRLAHGMYAWAGTPNEPLQVLRAMAAVLPSGAAFSGRTAGWLHGLDLPPCAPIEITLPPGTTMPRRTGLHVHRWHLAPMEVDVTHGLRTTRPLRTVLDLARRLTDVEAVVAADMALHRGLVTMRELIDAADARPHSYMCGRLRQVIVNSEPASESPMETRLRMVLINGGLPRPEAQVNLVDHARRVLGRVDLFYRSARLGLEYDGGGHRWTLAEDNRRQNRITNAGIRLLRFTARDVYDEPQALVATVRAELERGNPAYACEAIAG